MIMMTLPLSTSVHACVTATTTAHILLIISAILVQVVQTVNLQLEPPMLSVIVHNQLASSLGFIENGDPLALKDSRLFLNVYLNL